MVDIIKNFIEDVNLLDVFFFVIITYNVIQCFLNGFSLSLISFMKWVISTILTIILVPILKTNNQINIKKSKENLGDAIKEAIKDPTYIMLFFKAN